VSAIRELAEECATLHKENEQLRKNLDASARRIYALESVRGPAQLPPVRWSPFSDASISQACSRAITQGWIGEYLATGYVTDEEIAATGGRALDDTRADVLARIRHELESRAVVVTVRKHRPTSGVVLEARIIVGKLDGEPK